MWFSFNFVLFGHQSQKVFVMRSFVRQYVDASRILGSILMCVGMLPCMMYLLLLIGRQLGLVMKGQDGDLSWDFRLASSGVAAILFIIQDKSSQIMAIVTVLQVT